VCARVRACSEEVFIFRVVPSRSCANRMMLAAFVSGIVLEDAKINREHSIIRFRRISFILQEFVDRLGLELRWLYLFIIFYLWGVVTVLRPRSSGISITSQEQIQSQIGC
jgi:hypothetical protein